MFSENETEKLCYESGYYSGTEQCGYFYQQISDGTRHMLLLEPVVFGKEKQPCISDPCHREAAIGLALLRDARTWTPDVTLVEETDHCELKTVFFHVWLLERHRRLCGTHLSDKEFERLQFIGRAPLAFVWEKKD